VIERDCSVHGPGQDMRCHECALCAVLAWATAPVWKNGSAKALRLQAAVAEDRICAALGLPRPPIEDEALGGGE